VSVVGIVPAAGSGERLGSPEGAKAFVVCGGRPLYEWSVAALREVCERVVVAVPPQGQISDPRPQTSDFVPGGSSRSASVRNALAAAPEASVVVVQDAARPLVTRELVLRCLEGLERWDGAIAAAPVTDTIKEAGAGGQVLRTLDRSTLWAIQTPQVFRADVLRRALDVSEEQLAAATDDSALVEAAGGSVRVVANLEENLKVTRPSDLALAESLLRC
jgi:2-C-methyl-D-erythritol 4-phosphate cytidylyltransferase